MGIQAYSTTGKRVVKKGGTIYFYGKKYWAPFLIPYIGQEVFLRDFNYSGSVVHATTPDGLTTLPLYEKE